MHIVMSNANKHNFQAEIQHLLDIVIHSLYTDKEIFARELVSNAADACEKLRFSQTCGEPVFQEEIPLTISIKSDEKEAELTITDTGIGMTQEDLIRNLGTIAHSGTKSFLETLKKEGQKFDSKLIGQFGVGFYSSFMVADKVTVFTRSFRPEEQGWQWTSTGAGGYEIEQAPDLPRGTRIVLHIKEDCRQFLKEYELDRIVKRYSNFVGFPIDLNGKQLNTVQAIWTRNKSEVKEEDYGQFYQYLAHNQETPLFRLHFTADAPLAIQALLFVPNSNPELMGMSRIQSDVHLYSKKVLIQDRPKGLLPEWLRFLKGVVDSEDMPLNIAREGMQDTSLMQKLNKILTTRFLKFLEEKAESDVEAYNRFYAAFSRYLKEGIITEFMHVGALGKLVRYESSAAEAGKQISLADYVKRMQPEQKEIYFLIAANREMAETSPYYEVFKARNLEVLFLYDPIDEFVMEHLHGFEDKTLVSAEKAEVHLDANEKADEALSEEQGQELAKWFKDAVGEAVEDVRVTKRLVGTPAAVFEDDKFMTSSRRRLLKSMKSAPGNAPIKYILEINPNHEVICQLDRFRRSGSALATRMAEQILDNARMAAGILEDPRTMLTRLNELLVSAMKAEDNRPASAAPVAA